MNVVISEDLTITMNEFLFIIDTDEMKKIITEELDNQILEAIRKVDK